MCLRNGKASMAGAVGERLGEELEGVGSVSV